ncbi:MAG: exo-beta-N-acetylmuramidase NamZ domain-containing protein [Bdellovibrionales bacterium]
MKLGIEVMQKKAELIRLLKKQRVALVGHPASVDSQLIHSLDLLKKKLNVTAAFGPQHGIKGDKQDNMIESDDFLHPDYQIPIFSLYGKVRKPTPEMMDSFDVLIFDLQDLGCRIYTFVTTLLYVMQACDKAGKSLVVLDRPNPAGRTVEGFSLREGYESFVGASDFPMRHGLTVGELALYFKDRFHLSLNLLVVPMQGYQISKKGEWGWPKDRVWVNPSPNAPTLNMARCYSGSVMLEGTTLSEGRGTTRALELVGAPDLDFSVVLKEMHRLAPQWMKGALIRECFFEPTFHKHAHQLCHGFQLHTDFPGYKPESFKPFRLFALLFKAIRQVQSDYPLWRDFEYEYTSGKLAIDVINGGPELREWVDDSTASAKDLEQALQKDEKDWIKSRKAHLLYK